MAVVLPFGGGESGFDGRGREFWGRRKGPGGVRVACEHVGGGSRRGPFNRLVFAGLAGIQGSQAVPRKRLKRGVGARSVRACSRTSKKARPGMRAVWQGRARPSGVTGEDFAPAVHALLGFLRPLIVGGDEEDAHLLYCRLLAPALGDLLPGAQLGGAGHQGFAVEEGSHVVLGVGSSRYSAPISAAISMMRSRWCDVAAVEHAVDHRGVTGGAGRDGTALEGQVRVLVMRSLARVASWKGELDVVQASLIERAARRASVRSPRRR